MLGFGHGVDELLVFSACAGHGLGLCGCWCFQAGSL